MDYTNFRWRNESSLRMDGDTLIITAPPKTDYFVDPLGTLSKLNAPFYYTEVTGDFTLKAKVWHPFREVYDSCTLMVMDKDDVWAKCCFEGTDYGTHAAVSVVTKGSSDDANGSDIDQPYLWLQLCRKGNVFASHYSLDGEKWIMTRYYSLSAAETVKVGFVAQSPIGEGSEMSFADVSLTSGAPENMRAGK